MSAKSNLTVVDGDLLDNLYPFLFREIIGSLQYMTITRPDISFTVNFLSQFLSQLRVPHLVAVKRILRYAKGTLDHGLWFEPQRQPIHLSAYLDAD